MHTVSCFVTHTHVYSCVFICTYMEGHHHQCDTCALSWQMWQYFTCVYLYSTCVWPTVPLGDNQLISDHWINCWVPRTDYVPLVGALVYFVHSYIYCTCHLHMLLSWPTHCIVQYRMSLCYTSDTYLHLYFCTCCIQSVYQPSSFKLECS